MCNFPTAKKTTINCVYLCKVHTFGRRSTGGEILPFLGVNIVHVRSFTETRYTIISAYNIHLATYKCGSVTCNLWASTGQLNKRKKNIKNNELRLRIYRNGSMGAIKITR